jgi:hypothetical protein
MHTPSVSTGSISERWAAKVMASGQRGRVCISRRHPPGCVLASQALFGGRPPDKQDSQAPQVGVLRTRTAHDRVCYADEVFVLFQGCHS